MRALSESQVRTVLACSGFDGDTEPAPELEPAERDTWPAPPPCECHFPDQAPPLGKEWCHAPGCLYAAARGQS